MEELSRIRKNSFFYFISIVSRLISNSILFIIVANYYGAGIYGSFTAAHTLSMLLLILADFGFDLLIISEISKNRGNAIQVFNRYFPFKIFLSLISFIILNSLVFILPISSITRQLVFLFSFNMVFTAIMNMFFAFFRGIERFDVEAVISSAANVLIFICTILMSVYKLNILFIALSISLIRILSAAAALKKLNLMYGRLSFVDFYKDLSKTGKQILIFGLHLFFGTLYFQIDTVLLMSMKGDVDTGIYQASFKLLTMSLIVPELIVGSSFPTLSRLFSINDKSWMDTNRLVLKILLIISIPLALIILVFPNNIISIIYTKKEYSNAASLLAVSGLILLVRYLAEPFAMCLTITNKQLIRTRVVIIATFINLILNLIFIPMWSYNAAIWVSFATNTFVLIAYVFSLGDLSKELIKKNKALHALLFLIMGYLGLIVVRNHNFFLVVAVFLFIYSLCAYFFLLEDKERKMVIKLLVIQR